MALIILRHARVDEDYVGRYNSWNDISIDVRDVDCKLPIPREYDCVYSSDLLRCKQTLEILGFKDYVCDSRLREVRFRDDVEGLTFDEVSKFGDFRDELLNDIESWHRYICQESIVDFESRIKSFLLDLPKKQNILISTHGGVISKIMEIYGIDISTLGYLEFIRIDDYGI